MCSMFFVLPRHLNPRDASSSRGSRIPASPQSGVRVAPWSSTAEFVVTEGVTRPMLMQMPENICVTSWEVIIDQFESGSN